MVEVFALFLTLQGYGFHENRLEGILCAFTMKGEAVPSGSQQRHGLKPLTLVAMIIVAIFSVWFSQIPNAPWSSKLYSRPGYLFPSSMFLKAIFSHLLFSPGVLVDSIQVLQVHCIGPTFNMSNVSIFVQRFQRFDAPEDYSSVTGFNEWY